MFPIRHPSLNQLWSSLLLEELNRWGVTHCCLAPGSRSTPLVMAASQQPQLQLHHHFDERGLGFVALGLAKASDSIVAVITTSGSAVANLYPALIEAHQSGVRLILITADRPPRLHDCGANQSIRQPGIFADYTRDRIDLEPPTREFPARQLLSRVDKGMRAISTPQGGVLHINCMFDEPLYPKGQEIDFCDYLSDIDDWCCGDQPLTPAANPAALLLPESDAWQAFADAPGLIVAGALQDRQSAQAVLNLARRLGWPVLADIQSQLKFDPECLGLAGLLLCQEPARGQLLRARHLLQCGGRLVSKRLQAFVDEHPWKAFWLVHPGDFPLAPGRNSSHFYCSPIAPWCQALSGDRFRGTTLEDGGEPCWGEPLNAMNKELARRLAQQFDAPQPLSEPAVVYQLLKSAPADSSLFAGNSLCIRLLEMVGGILSARLRIFANRGASGIDGLLATAAGCARVDSSPCTLLLGDTSLLYDLNSLALVRDLPGPLAIVVINNDGGGIFRMLPVADEQLLQEHYQRPHGRHFGDACRMFDLAYARPETLEQFSAIYRQTLEGRQTRVIEVITDAQETVRAVQQLTQTATQ